MEATPRDEVSTPAMSRVRTSQSLRWRHACCTVLYALMKFEYLVPYYSNIRFKGDNSGA